MILMLLARMGLPEWVAKFVEVLLVIGAVVGSYWWAYHDGKTTQAEADREKIALYNQQITANAKVIEGALASLLKGQQALAVKMGDAVDKIEKQKTNTITILKQEIVHDVPKAVDDRSVACNVFTIGWVWDYNMSIASEAPSGISEGRPTDVTKATGLTASSVVNIAAQNNAECVARGEIIGQWQDWYTGASAAYTEFLKTVPPPPKSVKF